MEIYLSPQSSDVKSVIKFNGEKVQVNSKLYDFTDKPNGSLITKTEDIVSAKRTDGKLFVKIVNRLDETATDKELFPEWQVVDNTEKLDEGLVSVELEWITQEELDEIENAPKPLSEFEKLRLEQAQANSELVQLIMTMGGV